MMGLETENGAKGEKGVIPQAIEHVFRTRDINSKRNFLVQCSYLEIYNEEINDLLVNDKNPDKLTIKEGKKGFVVSGPSDSGLREERMHNLEGCMELIKRGNQRRKVGLSDLNEHSSRSHSIFRMVLQSQADGNSPVRTSELNLVDLAGSEKLSSNHGKPVFACISTLLFLLFLAVYPTHFARLPIHHPRSLPTPGGQQKKETININLALTSLKTVIEGLSDPKYDPKKTHIKYRDSILTMLLKNSLGGNSKTVLLLFC
jgi:centromeric protein E